MNLSRRGRFISILFFKKKKNTNSTSMNNRGLGSQKARAWCGLSTPLIFMARGLKFTSGRLLSRWNAEVACNSLSELR